jgi:tetratricopeptide (TPR) repeat protein
MASGYRDTTARLPTVLILAFISVLSVPAGSTSAYAQNSLESLRPFTQAARDLPTDSAGALEWLVIGRARLAYDAARCTDPSIGGGFSFLAGQWAGAVIRYARRHPRQYLDALKRAQQRGDLFVDEAAPPAICGNGIDAYRKSLGIDPGQQRAAVKPPSEWPAIQSRVREALAQRIETLEKKIAAEPSNDYEPAPFPTAVPAALVSGPRDEKVTLIGAAAREAAVEEARESPDPDTLMSLAQAQLDAGDTGGARETLVQAQAVFAASHRERSERLHRERLITLLVKAGNAAAAKALVDRIVDPLWRVDAFGSYAVALAASGDTARATEVLDEIERIVATVKKAALVAATESMTDAWRPHPSVIALDIGDALIAAGAFAGASKIAARDPKFRTELLAKIAAKQCLMRDKNAREALRKAKQAAQANKELDDRAGEELAYALASCDDVPGARATVARMWPGRQGLALEAVVNRLTEHGQYGPAKAIDAVTHAEELTGDARSKAYALSSLALRQVARGDIADARETSKRAYHVVQMAVEANPQSGTLDMPIGQIINTQIKEGAYDDAFTTAKLEDPVNRVQYLVEIIAAEAEARQADALHAALPGVVAEVEANWSTAYHLTRVAEALGEAGYRREARDVLAHVRKSYSGCADKNVWNCFQFADADLAMGDFAEPRTAIDTIDDPDMRDHVLRRSVDVLLGRTTSQPSSRWRPKWPGRFKTPPSGCMRLSLCWER